MVVGGGQAGWQFWWGSACGDDDDEGRVEWENPGCFIHEFIEFTCCRFRFQLFHHNRPQVCPVQAGGGTSLLIYRKWREWSLARPDRCVRWSILGFLVAKGPRSSALDSLAVLLLCLISNSPTLVYRR